MDASHRHRTALIAIAGALLLLTGGCDSRRERRLAVSRVDSIAFVRNLLSFREEKDAFFRSSPYSPFAGDTSVHFSGIKWFPPRLEYYFRSTLTRYPRPEEVIVFGTKGERRRQVKYGYFEIPFDDRMLRLHVYKDAESQDPESRRRLAVWFTDSTTTRETYGVGRYLDVDEERDDPDFLYTIDFNKAYNPYCAYSERYTCAVPRKEDHLDVAIRAGELKYHP